MRGHPRTYFIIFIIFAFAAWFLYALLNYRDTLTDFLVTEQTLNVYWNFPVTNELSKTPVVERRQNIFYILSSFIFCHTHIYVCVQNFLFVWHDIVRVLPLYQPRCIKVGGETDSAIRWRKRMVWRQREVQMKLVANNVLKMSWKCLLVAVYIYGCFNTKLSLNKPIIFFFIPKELYPLQCVGAQMLSWRLL